MPTGASATGGSSQRTVLLDASALGDGRARAGIGRYCTRLLQAFADQPPDDGLDLIPLRAGTPALGESRPGRFLSAQPALIGAIRRYRPALIHGMGGEPVASHRPQVVTIHDAELWRCDSRGHSIRGAVLGAHRRVLRAALRRSRLWIAVSSTAASEAVELIGLDPSRGRVVPLGVDAIFTPVPGIDDSRLRAACGAPTDYLMWVGSLRSLDRRKGLDVLVGALAQLPGEAPPLLLVGEPGAGLTEILRSAAACGVRARGVGRVDDPTLAALYRGARAAVVPSRHEGFGLPLLEALACGAPVVATRAGNLADLAGDTAELVTPDSSEALKAGLTNVLGPGTRRDWLQRQGPLRAAAYTWEVCAARTAAVYQEALSVGPAG